MPESSGAQLKTSPNGVRGLAMMAPAVSLPLGIHALGGALVAVAGIAVTVAPLAVPVAVPLLYNAASKGGFDSIIRKFLPSAGMAGAAQNAVSQPVEVTVREAAPITGTVIEDNA